MDGGGGAVERDRRRDPIALIESDEIGTVGVGEATIPPIKSFNAGWASTRPISSARPTATFKLGIEFVGWGAAAGRYFHPSAPTAPISTASALHQWWLREHLARRHDAVRRLFDGLGIARATNRFGPPVDNPRDVRSTHAYAYHFDAGLYAALMRRYAEARGVVRHEGKVVEVARDAQTGHVAPSGLPMAASVAGDFFVDCSGFRGLLIERGAGRRLRGLDALAAMRSRGRDAERARAGRADALHALDRARAPAGNGASRSSTGRATVMSIARAMSATTRRPRRCAPASTARRWPSRGSLRFTTGRRRELLEWQCVSLGLAAGFMEPLEFDQPPPDPDGRASVCSRLLPDRHHDPLNAEEFNRATVERMGAHPRFPDPPLSCQHAPRAVLAATARRAPMPDELAYKLKHFAADARLVSPERRAVRQPELAGGVSRPGHRPARLRPARRRAAAGRCAPRSLPGCAR